MKMLNSITTRLGICFGLAATLWSARPVLATTLTVTTTNDSGAGSLRQAIAEAAPGDTINFTITGTITLTTGELLVTNNLDVIGPGATNLALSGNRTSRIFTIGANVTVHLSGITIREGHASDGTSPGGDGAPGGSCYNAGTLSLTACTITDNSGGRGGAGSCCSPAAGGNGGNGGAGGAIYNAGSLTLNTCTVSANSVLGGAGGSGGAGGGNGGLATGGAIASAGSLMLTDCTLSGNSATGGSGGDGSSFNFGFAGTGALAQGGAIFVSGGTVVLSNSVLSGNTARGGTGGSGAQFGAYGAQGGEGKGGGIFAVGVGGPLIVMSSTFAGNHAIAGAYGYHGASSASGSDAAGGGIYVGGGKMTLLNATFLDNATVAADASVGAAGNGGTGGTGRGGAMFLNNLTNAVTIGSTFYNNRAAGGSGGSISPSSSSGSGSGGSGLGGGIFVSAGDLTFTNTTLSGNWVAGGTAGTGGRNGQGSAGLACGGGIYWSGAGAMVSSTTASNSALPGIGAPNFFPGGGSGICNASPGILSLLNCVVAGNNSTSNIWDLAGTLASQGHNLIGMTDGSAGWIASDLTGTSATPLEAKLGPLQNNGGPTLTHALLAGSPAIDKGGSGGPTTDQRGRARPYDFSAVANASGGDGSDIGAFELNPPLSSIARAAGNVVLSWPVYDTGYTLEAATNLNPTLNWSNVAGIPAIVAGKLTVTNSATTGNKFYRLRSP